MKPVMKRLVAVESARNPPTPWERKPKAERDAEVATGLDDPIQVRAIMVRLVGEDHAGVRTAPAMARRAAARASA